MVCYSAVVNTDTHTVIPSKCRELHGKIVRVDQKYTIRGKQIPGGWKFRLHKDAVETQRALNAAVAKHVRDAAILRAVAEGLKLAVRSPRAAKRTKHQQATRSRPVLPKERGQPRHRPPKAPAVNQRAPKPLPPTVARAVTNQQRKDGANGGAVPRAPPSAPITTNEEVRAECDVLQPATVNRREAQRELPVTHRAFLDRDFDGEFGEKMYTLRPMTEEHRVIHGAYLLPMNARHVQKHCGLCFAFGITGSGAVIWATYEGSEDEMGHELAALMAKMGCE